MPRTVRLRLLGSFDARWSDGKPLGLSGKKVQALVAYLAVEGDRMHTREELSALLWGETGDERARHNLRQALSKIRRTCDSLIVAKGDALQLDDRLCEADVRDFEELVSCASPLSTTGFGMPGHACAIASVTLSSVSPPLSPKGVRSTKPWTCSDAIWRSTLPANRPTGS
jgi:hypothetical protein